MARRAGADRVPGCYNRSAREYGRPGMAMTRRGLLNAVARLGGAGAVYETLAVWDFLKPPPALAAGLELPKASGAGKTVAVLGAGVSGLCAACELDRAGHEVVILDGTRRLGGVRLSGRPSGR